MESVEDHWGVAADGGRMWAQDPLGILDDNILLRVLPSVWALMVITFPCLLD
jgi:hypothetical protein